MRGLTVLLLFGLAIPAAATAGTTTRTNEQAQRQELKRPSTQCVVRDTARRDSASKTECKVNRTVPPVVDPTPIFLP